MNYSTNNVALAKGTKINDYTISKKISAGGFSVVYLAYDKLENPVAIKEFFPNHLHLRNKGDKVNFINIREKLKFNEGLKSFKEEGEMVMKLKHKNIIEVINFFELNGTAYLVMPYEYGMTLGKYINSEDMCEEDFIKIVEGVFSAVQMFHENNLIHLDLKPGNIWVRPDKEALILDFGTARVISENNRNMTAPMHTPGYAAPEQHKDYFQPERIGYWTDYYGLGATLYALLEKQSPIPSVEYMKNKKLKLIKRRKGQYNFKLLEITELLLSPNWKNRKKINLKQIIQDLKLIKHMPIQNSLKELI